MNQKKVISVFAMALAVMFCTKTSAQKNAFTIYYDSVWKPVTKESAFYYTQFVKLENYYQCTSYWAGTNTVYCKSAFVDTVYQPGIGNFKKAVGDMVRYHKNGTVSDSIQVDGNGKMWQQFGYSEKGKRTFHLLFDKNTNSWTGNVYDSLTTVQIPASFPGGQAGWQEYLSTHLNTKVPSRHKAPAGNYTVIVSFAVDTDGKIINVVADNDPGYGTTEEAIRVIEKAPSWIPAWQNGKNVLYKQKQSIIFQVSER